MSDDVIEVLDDTPEVSGSPTLTSTPRPTTPQGHKVMAPCWGIFVIKSDDPTKAECTLCNKSYSRGKRDAMGTSNLKRHLQKDHPNEYAIEGEYNT